MQWPEFWPWKSGTKSRVDGIEVPKRGHISIHALLWERLEGLIRMHGLSWEKLGVDQQNINLSKGLGTWKGWLSPEGSIAPEEGHIGIVLSVPLP